jgi:hypothetical protein
MSALVPSVFANITSGNQFIGYLGRAHEFYDGENSQVAIKTAACSNDTGTVQGYFKSSNNASTCTVSAITCNEGSTNKLRTFFEPRAISLANQGVTDGNIALLFHEALHGFSKLDDPSLQKTLGCTQPVGNPIVGYSTYDITLFLQQFIGAQPLAGAPTTCVAIENKLILGTNLCVR